MRQTICPSKQAKREQTKDRSEEEMGERTVASKALPFGANEAHVAEHLRRQESKNLNPHLVAH
jgi:hypothetical protein